MSKSYMCDTHKQNLVPNHCKECSDIVAIEKMERDVQEFANLAKELFDACGDKVRSAKIDEIIEESRIEKERIDKEYGHH